MAAVAFKKLLQVNKGTAAASGGTFTADFAIPTDRVARVEVRAFLCAQTGGAGHIVSASMYCEGVYENQNGTLAAVTTFPGGSNPYAASNLVGSRAQASDAAFTSTGGTVPPALALSISSTNVRATLTNNSDSSQAADATVYFEVFLSGAA